MHTIIQQKTYFISEEKHHGQNSSAPYGRQEGSFLSRRRRRFPHSRFPRDGRFIEEIGTYNPCVSPAEIKIDAERAQEWIKTGAQPTDTVRALLKRINAI